MKQFFTLTLLLSVMQVFAAPFHFLAAPTNPTTAFAASSNDGDRINLSWTSGNGTRRIVIARKEAAVTASPVNGVNYNANILFGSGFEIAPGEFVVYNNNNNSTSVTNLEPGTQYHFAVFEYNGTGTGVEYLIAPARVSAFTISAPTGQPNNAVISAINGNSMKLSWTNPLAAVAGSGRIVIGREGAPVNVNPQDLVDYVSQSQFGSGSQIGSGNFVVSKGNNNSVTLTNLKPGTIYHYAVFEYKGNDALVFNINNPAIASAATLPRPTVHSTSPVFSNVEGPSLRISFTKGNGARRIVVIKAGTAVSGNPADGETYDAETVFGSGEQIAPGEYVVMNGTADNVSVTGLTKNTVYHFAVFEYDGTGSFSSYFVTDALQTSQSTLTAPVTQASGLSITGLANNSATINWTNGSGSKRLVLVRKDGPVNVLPSDYSQYGASTNYGSGSHLGNGVYSVYNNTGSSVTVNNLVAGTTYHVSVFEMNGSTSPVYLTSNAPETQFTTGQAPTQAPGAISFQHAEGNRLTVSWTNGNGARRILVAKQGSAVTGTPVDGTIYNAQASFTAGQQLAPGEYVVMNSTNSQVTVTNLLPGTTYHFAVFEYNLVNNVPFYLSVPGSSNSSTVTAPATNSSAMVFTNVTGNSMKLTWTKGNGKERIVVAKKGSAVDGFPADLSSYNHEEIFGQGAQIGSENYVVYAGTSNSVTVLGLDPGETYHYAVLEYNGSNFPVYLFNGALTASQQTLDRPSVAASHLNFVGVEGNRILVKWTAGNGSKRILVGRAGAPVSTLPQDGTDYVSNLSFGTANTKLDDEHFVLADGVMIEASVTNLQPGITYHFAVFEYDGTGTNIRYQVSNFGDGSRSTLVAPADGPTNVLFSNIGTATTTVNWTAAVADRYIVVMRKTLPVAALPQQLRNYSSSTSFGHAGSLMAPEHSVVYNSAANTVNVTNLQPGVTYHVSVFAFNGLLGPVYNTTHVASGTVTTLGPPQDAATNVRVSSVHNAHGSINIQWANGSGQRRLVVMKAVNAVDAVPANNTTYVANNFYGSGQEIGSGNFVVYNGTADNVIVNNLQLGISYHIAVFEYNQFSTGPVYLTTIAGRAQLDSWVLPVKLQSFSGVAGNRNNVLSWTTSSEINNVEFLVERSANGTNFHTIGRVAAAGNSSVSRSYRFEDNSRMPVSFYRLRMVDVNGRSEYSNVIRLQSEKEKGLKLFPTLASSSIQFNLHVAEKTEVVISVIDMSGRIMMQRNEKLDAGVVSKTIDVSRLISGSYLLQVMAGEKIFTEKFVRQ